MRSFVRTLLLSVFVLAIATAITTPARAQIISTVVPTEGPTFEAFGTLLSISTGDPDTQPGIFLIFHLNGGAIEYGDCLDESVYGCPAFQCDADSETDCLNTIPGGCYQFLFSLEVSSENLSSTPVLRKAYLLTTSPCAAP